jgi:uncharacterized protein YkwD
MRADRGAASAARPGAWALPLLLSGCVGIAVPSAPLPAPSGPAATAPPASVAAVEAEVHQRINRHRESRGLAPLAHDERVAEIARRHSRAMAERRTPFGHDGFEARAEEVGRLFTVGRLAENVAYDSRPEVAARVVEGWIRSSGHRANLEGPFDVTGVGAARAPDGTYYFTQIFAARRGPSPPQ